MDTKTGTLALQDARLPCGKRMAYAAVGGGLNAEPAIRFLGQKGLGAESAIRLPDRKDSIQNRALWLCRMPDCHAISAWPMLRSEGGGYKNRHHDFAGCPIAMQQAHGLCCSRREDRR